MATHTLPAGASPANAPTRRGFIGGALAAPTLVAAPALAAPASDRAAWDSAMRAYQLAKASSAAFNRDYWTPAWEAWIADCAALPHTTMKGEPRLGLHPASTDDPKSIKWARYHASATYHDPRDEGLAAMAAEYRRVVAAADSRDAATYRLAEAYNLDALGNRSEQLAEAEDEAEARLLALPAPDIAALAWKMLQLLTPDGHDNFTPSWSGEYVAPVLADARRLAGRA